MEDKKIATFCERFTELINSSSKSRSAIASEFGVAKQTISSWTTGQACPRLPVITSLADYFGVNIRWLLGFDVPKYINSDEVNLISVYRSLSPRGQSLLIDRSEELKLLYGKKSEDHSSESF